MAVNWCTSCKCVLANEEVVGGVCERCHSEVVRKVKSQWMLKITEYAERLINDLDLVDYPDRVKAQQKTGLAVQQVQRLISLQLRVIHSLYIQLVRILSMVQHIWLSLLNTQLLRSGQISSQT